MIREAPSRVFRETSSKSSSALDRLRTPAITRCPEFASCRTNSRPIPLDAPTTTHIPDILVDCRGVIVVRRSMGGRTAEKNSNCALRWASSLRQPAAQRPGPVFVRGWAYLFPKMERLWSQDAKKQIRTAAQIGRVSLPLQPLDRHVSHSPTSTHTHHTTTSTQGSVFTNWLLHAVLRHENSFLPDQAGIYVISQRAL